MEADFIKALFMNQNIQIFNSKIYYSILFQYFFTKRFNGTQLIAADG